jgi:polyisoprenyl-phosphate glycosyltransferase
MAMSSALPATAGGRLWFVTPIYRDVEPFLILRERLLEVVSREPALAGMTVRFVALDDAAGRDPEVERLRLLEDVNVIQPPFTLGHQRAIVYALRQASRAMSDGDLVVTLDADGEDRPEDTPQLLAALEEDAGDPDRVVLALRTGREAPARFRLLYAAFRVVFRLLTGKTVRTGNYAAFRASFIKRLLLHPAFDLSYSSAMLALELPVRYVPCRRGRRYSGESRMSYSALALHGVRMLMPFTDRIALRALFVFASALGAALVIAIVGLTVKYVAHTAIPGWATSVLLGALILSLVALGNFVTLFLLFSQLRAVSLANLEEIGPETGELEPATLAGRE